MLVAESLEGIPMPRPSPALVLVASVLVILSGCGGGTKEEVPSKDTIECTIEQARWLIRFTDGEARLLTPDGQRINLYQVAAPSGVRFTNGLMELRGQGMELALTSEGIARRLEGCKPLMVPKEDPNPMRRMFEPAPRSPLGM